MDEPKETNEILMMSIQWSPIRHQPDASPPGTNIAFLEDDPVLEHYNGEDPLIIKADIRGTVIHRVYVDEGSSTEIILPLKLKEELQKLLRANQDIFAWSPLDMTGIPRELAEHKLNIHPSTFPVRQKKRVLAERNDAVNQEVIKLVKAIILKEVYSPRWVANPVMVRKNDGTWRMCIDFTNLNKACPKDSYPLPEIDQKIESLEGFRFKCFLDAYKGYHQIRMAEEDEEKTAFYTEHGTFCYKKMPFGLRNAGATYQRLVDKAFSSQLGRNIKIYVDDMVIKSRNIGSLIADIEETFHPLRGINMKLNPKKCVFGVETGQFLGHVITREGIEANPEKVKAIIDMVSP
ncbi:reverse transcriptase domain-containing protein [Tanacetum coccineum]